MNDLFSWKQNIFYVTRQLCQPNLCREEEQAKYGNLRLGTWYEQSLIIRYGPGLKEKCGGEVKVQDAQVFWTVILWRMWYVPLQIQADGSDLCLNIASWDHA